MTTSRMVVVLRTELGTQLSLAQKELDRIRTQKNEELGLHKEWTEEYRKPYMRWDGIRERLQKTIHALGALQLGDIEDKEI